MANENVYNWDDLEVGRVDLNHSENFFARKHNKHEKLNEINLEFLSIMDSNGAEKNPFEPINSQEDHRNVVKKTYAIKIVTNSENILKESNGASNGDAAPRNILRQPLINSNIICAKVRSQQVGPALLKYKELYEKKRQNTIQRMIEEERKNRIFRSKPAPNFAAFSKVKKPTDILRQNTCPITPKVLKKSVEFEERRKRLIEEHKKRNEPLKFTSRNPQVLYEEPFKPIKVEHHVELHPFKLHMEKRLEERKQYDKQFKQIAEEKKRQVYEEEEIKKQREEQIVREIRKNITFKARPNPFK